jgi:MerR family copper efflux transcriptional regulator
MENDSMNIGEMAKAAGVSAKMIRHYESIGLLSPASRSDSGYRRYGEKDVGFSLEEIKNLLGLWQDRTRPSREVKSLAQQHLDFLDKKLEEILSMKTALAHLISCCHGDERPDCPILEGLAGAKGKV